MPNSQLDQNFISEQKEKLELKKQRLLEELLELDTEDPYMQSDRATDNSEEVDEAILEDYTKTQIEAKKNNINIILEQINKALSRIETGEYGVCELTGKEIDKARLVVYPEASTTLEAEKDSVQA